MIPKEMNKTPTTKKDGITVFGVIMGCQARSLCCLNAVFAGFLDRIKFPSAIIYY
jgi:hypothetical protein